MWFGPAPDVAYALSFLLSHRCFGKGQAPLYSPACVPSPVPLPHLKTFDRLGPPVLRLGGIKSSPSPHTATYHLFRSLGNQ